MEYGLGQRDKFLGHGFHSACRHPMKLQQIVTDPWRRFPAGRLSGSARLQRGKRVVPACEGIRKLEGLPNDRHGEEWRRGGHVPAGEVGRPLARE